MGGFEGGRGAEDGGGGGAAEGVGALLGGGRGAEAGGGGGAAGVEGTAGAGGKGAAADGFLDVIGGGGGFAPLGGGGGARGGSSELDRKEASDFGRWAGFGGGFLRFATSGLAAANGCGGEDSVVCGLGLKAFSLGAVGGFGAMEVGGFGADCLDVSGSDMYDGSRSAPVSTPPPVFLNFGIPTPAKIPPSCGAVLPPKLSPPPVVSLLLLPRFGPPAPAPGTGGARPLDGLPRPGTAGAPPTGGPAEAPDGFPTMGADRSFVTAFFNLAPLLISVRRAPWYDVSLQCSILEGSAASAGNRNSVGCSSFLSDSPYLLLSLAAASQASCWNLADLQGGEGEGEVPSLRILA